MNDLDNEPLLNDSQPEAQPELSSNETSRPTDKPSFQPVYYKRRWYILVVFCLMAAAQSHNWNTWGPIANSAEFSYNWGDGMISLLAAWGPVMFMLSIFPFSWLMETKGLRIASVISAAFVFAGTGARCISQKPPLCTWLINIGQIGVSLAGPIAMAGATVMSARWFPPHQRVTATAIASRSMALGGGLPFIVGPLAVKDVGNFTVNSTAAHNRKKNFWLLGLPYSIAYGMYIGWGACLDVNLKPFGFSQRQAGYLGFYGMLSGAITGVIMARIVDVMSGRTKPVLLFLYITACGGVLWFTLVCEKIAPSSTASLYSSRIISATCMSAMVPLVFETLCETTYPAPESVTNAVLTLLKNFWCLVFLSVVWIPNIGTDWMNWLLVGASGACVPMVILFEERHGRLDVDNAHSRALEEENTINS